MTTANAKNLTSVRERWQNDPTIPRWKKDAMIDLVLRLEEKIKAGEDAYEKRNVKLYFPQDCCNYDVFQTVGCALEARISVTPDGLVMNNFGKCRGLRGIE